MFYIRTDANPTIATGHVMRCISIAKEINKLGEKVTFITADLQAQDLIKQNGFTLLCLDSLWNNLEVELVKLIRVIQENEIECLLIDSYYISENYLKELRKYTKIIYLDDLAEFPYPVDVLINYNNFAKNIGYENWAEKTRTKLVLGCKYAPLREEFRGITKVPGQYIRRVLVTTGGSDSYHVTRKFFQWFIQINKETSKLQIHSIIKNIEFHIVVGKFNLDIEVLKNIESTYPNIILHMNVSNMSELMKESDLAITAGGSTLYELCACGVPMITYSFSDNQLPGVREFEQLGIAKYCGDIRDGEIELWKKILETLQFHIENPTCHNKIMNCMKNLIDGYGACRLAEILLDMKSKNVEKTIDIK